MSKIHIHLHPSTKDAAPSRKPNFGISDIAIGGTVIYKEGSGWRMSKAVSTSGMKIKLATGKEISVGDVWSTDASDWSAFRNATADANQPFTRAASRLTEALNELDIVAFKDKGSVQTFTPEEKQKAVDAARLISQARNLLK